MIETNDSLNFKIGNKVEESLCQVDIWLGDVHLTPFDNIVYIPQFIASMSHELEQLKLRKIDPDGIFLNLGPTTDDCSSKIVLIDNFAETSFELDGNNIYKLVIDIDDLIYIYQSTINKLGAL